MAVRGALGLQGPEALAITTEAEHHAVHDPVERSGGVLVGVDKRGIVDLAKLEDVLRAHDGDVAVVSVIAVNNEIGSITPLPAVARVVRDHAPQALLHTDAVQAVNWIDVAAETADYDLVSVTGHKVGSPVGTGVLVVRDGVELDPLIIGGGQERGRRAGTPDVAGAVSFAAALAETTEQRDESVERLGALRDGLIDGLIDRLGGRVLVSAGNANGDRSHIAAGIANVCIAGVQSEALLFLIDAAGVPSLVRLLVLKRRSGPVPRAGRDGGAQGGGAWIAAALARAHHRRLRRGSGDRGHRGVGRAPRPLRGRLRCPGRRPAPVAPGCWSPCRAGWTPRWPRLGCWTPAMTWPASP